MGDHLAGGVRLCAWSVVTKRAWARHLHVTAQLRSRPGPTTFSVIQSFPGLTKSYPRGHQVGPGRIRNNWTLLRKITDVGYPYSFTKTIRLIDLAKAPRQFSAGWPFKAIFLFSTSIHIEKLWPTHLSTHLFQLLNKVSQVTNKRECLPHRRWSTKL